MKKIYTSKSTFKTIRLTFNIFRRLPRWVVFKLINTCEHFADSADDVTWFIRNSPPELVNKYMVERLGLDPDDIDQLEAKAKEIAEELKLRSYIKKNEPGRKTSGSES